MIDTIVIRIHKIKTLNTLKEQLYATKNKNKGFTTCLIDEDTAEILAERNYVPVTIFHDTSNIIAPVYRSHIHNSSSHYDLAFKIDEQKDYVEFNFSIPKYLYSTNVFQFINIFEQSSETQFNKLKLFLNQFFDKTFIKVPQPEYIEIHRIDFCYNQFFNTKDDALAYLEEQKKVLKTLARQTTKNNSRHYGTSLMYVTQNYSFKIYHKGTEFEKHDMKQLQKKNPFNLNLQRILHLANNILRYEYTIRSSQLMYLFKSSFFESVKKTDMPIIKTHKIYQLWQNLIPVYGSKFFNNYLRTSKFFTISSLYDLCANSRDLYINISQHNLAKNVQKDEYKFEDTVTFDLTLFVICYNEFWKLVNKFQLDVCVNLIELKQKVQTLNKNKKKRKELGISTKRDDRNMDYLKVLLLSHLINSGGKLHDLKQYMPSSSYYLFRSQLKELGINESSATLTIAKPRIDYLDYRLALGNEHNRISTEKF